MHLEGILVTYNYLGEKYASHIKSESLNMEFLVVAFGSKSHCTLADKIKGTVYTYMSCTFRPQV